MNCQILHFVYTINQPAARQIVMVFICAEDCSLSTCQLFTASRLKYQALFQLSYNLSSSACAAVDHTISDQYTKNANGSFKYMH